MKLNEIIRKLNLVVRVDNNLSQEVTSGYSSDLLSDVIAYAQDGDLWITLQTHQNIIAVASMKNLAGIILVNNREPEDETMAKAREENIPLMVSDLPSFELIGRLYNFGLSGLRK